MLHFPNFKSLRTQKGLELNMPFGIASSSLLLTPILYNQRTNHFLKAYLLGNPPICDIYFYDEHSLRKWQNLVTCNKIVGYMFLASLSNWMWVRHLQQIAWNAELVRLGRGLPYIMPHKSDVYFLNTLAGSAVPSHTILRQQCGIHYT
jgi:hypothetical protein